MNKLLHKCECNEDVTFDGIIDELLGLIDNC